MDGQTEVVSKLLKDFGIQPASPLALTDGKIHFQLQRLPPLPFFETLAQRLEIPLAHIVVEHGRRAPGDAPYPPPRLAYFDIDISL